MQLRVNYGELDKVGNSVLSTNDEIVNIYKDILGLIDKVKSCWKGADADEFTSNASIYVNNQINECEKVKGVGKIAANLGRAYRENDESWEKDMKKRVDKDEL